MTRAATLVAALAAMLATALGAGCSARARTQLIVLVDTDLPSDALDHVKITLAPTDGTPREVETAVNSPGAPTWPLSLGVFSEGDGTGEVHVTVTGSQRDHAVVQTESRVSFVPYATRRLGVQLLRRCAGVVCASGERCDATGCGPIEPAPEASTAPESCGPFYAECDGNGSTHCETDLRTDVAHCGACGHACGAGGRCEAGVCDRDRVVSIAAGEAHTCAVRASGETLCWGLNRSNQLGNMDAVMSPRPVTLPPGDGVAHVVAVAAGARHNCLRDDAGAVFCWGANVYGQLGDGSMRTRSVPTSVGGLPGPIDEIVAGQFHTCARRRDGDRTVVCWGFDGDQQLGDGDQSTETGRARSHPVPTGLTDIVRLAAGDLHNCALRADGTLLCWGGNASGQVGSGDPAESIPVPTPVRWSGTISVTDVAAGVRNTCALRTDRQMVCWGENDVGQLGLGTVGMTRRMPGLPSVEIGLAGIEAGGDFECGVRPTGVAVCWGSNVIGQLGRGGSDGAPHPTPDAIAGPTDLAQVTAGARHACALRRWGGVLCWGDNASGQLGDGTTTVRARPGFVLGLP